MELYDNKLSGLVPSSLEYLTNIETLNLDGNSFYGPLPPALWSMHGLVSLDLSGNQFLGSVPTEIGLLTNLCTYLCILALAAFEPCRRFSHISPPVL